MLLYPVWMNEECRDSQVLQAKTFEHTYTDKHNYILYGKGVTLCEQTEGEWTDLVLKKVRSLWPSLYAAKEPPSYSGRPSNVISLSVSADKLARRPPAVSLVVKITDESNAIYAAEGAFKRGRSPLRVCRCTFEGTVAYYSSWGLTGSSVLGPGDHG